MQIKTENIIIENGNVKGITVSDKFSVRLASGIDVDLTADWNIDVPIDVAVTNMWGNMKVKMRAATLGKLTADEIRRMNGGKFDVLDYLTAKSVAASAQVKALKEQINTARDTAIRMFMEKALAAAIDELGSDATHEQRAARGSQIFDAEYAPIINMMHPVG